MNPLLEARKKHQDKPIHPAAYCHPGRGLSLSYIRGRCPRLLFGSALQAPECLWLSFSTTDKTGKSYDDWKQDKNRDKPTHPLAYCPPGRGFSLSFIRGPCPRLLIEADFLVNLYEDNESPKAIQTVRQKIFKTKSGLKMLDSMYGDTDQ